MADLPLEIASTLRATSTRLVRNLRRQSANLPFSHTDLLTLSLLHEHGSLLPSELSELERISAQAISQVINKLDEAGCIRKKADKTDKRKTALSLTPRGEKILQDNWQQKNEWLAMAMSDLFSEKEMKTIVSCLPLLQRLAAHNG
ncbi:MarR family winged helix-turn-helix transcriptional regulator [Taibaiella chishuiensis]|uniref:DNA-binding MarR family transcriptional regulator n=1 Tax=Taibaiella chishuiensis TaxID=1434707 RepID=A0A2P8D672_9BACT|nr:MarR family transcriptional regulator [Taibaiella chishuiensis]PSK92714.1 DNA-binding MarR family transcriptional regulator [Taibaiella chishuiensis]